MANPALLFLQHPLGDATTVPCIHLGFEHEYDVVKGPCLHGLRLKHPEGDTVQTPLGTVTVPCIHAEPIHPQGDDVKVPCVHLVPKHPDGHAGPKMPCSHPMPVVREEFGGLVKFYTGDTVIQKATMEAVEAFHAQGLIIASPVRPLQVFHRAPLEDGSSDDPFWSHYSPLHHSIQVMRRTNQSDDAVLETLRHELGHALLGHTPVNHYVGGSHTLTDPADSYALAMSEGWAHFVALFLTHARTEDQVDYRGLDWETPSGDPDGKVEYRVGCFLWDLFDTLKSTITNTPIGMARFTTSDDDDSPDLEFAELYSVYAPDLVAVMNGPWVSSVWDYADRLKLKLEGVIDDLSFIDDLLDEHCGPRPADLPVFPFAIAVRDFRMGGGQTSALARAHHTARKLEKRGR